MGKIVPQSFFERDAHDVARDLLGRTLVREYFGERIEAPILDLEVYDSVDDPGSAAYLGKTKNNAALWGPSGHWHLLQTRNLLPALCVTVGYEDYPAYLLIRATELSDKPSTTVRRFHAGKEHHGRSVSKRCNLWIEEGGLPLCEEDICTLPRTTHPNHTEQPQRYAVA